MSAKAQLRLVLCWHMHQPCYLDPVRGEYLLPWAYLHAIKDYVDMAAHLESVAGTRAVVNFTPTLLEQIDDFATQTRALLQQGTPMQDPLLQALGSAALPNAPNERIALVRACLRAQEERQTKRFVPYERLTRIAHRCLDSTEGALCLGDQYLADLLVWYHLVWLGETVRRSQGTAVRLMEKNQGFTSEDRRELLQLICELLSSVIGRYRRLAETGQIELSVTPYGHPIVPLLLNFETAREAIPEIALPAQHPYPGGEGRARWHIREALDCFRSHFGFAPRGCWPAEGGVCARTIELLREFGFSWVASGGGVLHHSLALSGEPHGSRHQPYRLAKGGPACFFRDDGLSDLIGFSYAEWQAEAAVEDLIQHLLRIKAAEAGGRESVVCIIMDGENAWEHYPENGYDFLSSLYSGLVCHPEIELTTFSELLERGLPCIPLSRLVAGSWVYGTFSTWIGEPAKNQAW
ncbi:MAG: glycoside hydrolase family 57 protein, partial [Gammaproteobacteria bacterium]